MPQNFIYEKYHEKKKQKKKEAKTKDATDNAQQERKEEEEEVWAPEKENEMYVYDEALSHVHRLERGGWSRGEEVAGAGAKVMWAWH